MTESELCKYVVDKAVSYGMTPKNLPKNTDFDKEIKDKVSKDGGNAIIRHSLTNGAYIGLIDPGQPIVEDDYESESANDMSGAYTGLSFVVFTQCSSKEDINNEQEYCIVSIAIGSSSLGDDLDLASKPGFRRSFMKLTKKCEGKDEEKYKDQEADYFFVENWAAMESRCPGLKEKVDKIEKEGNGPLHCSLDKYDKLKLLPAACVIKLPPKKDNGIPALDAWLAKYAQWRGWMAKSNLSSEIKQLFETKRTPDKEQTVIDQEIEDLLNEHRFVVLQGAPGCGKTWSANKIASSKKKNDKDKNEYNKVFFTQFHAETTYADFVYGIKPALKNGNLGYEGKAGILLDAINYAARHDDKVLLIIDEINRANLANVLGPVFYLFEPNATNREHELYLGQIADNEDYSDLENNIYSVDNGNIYCKALPSNLYVIATMNTADKSLAVVDFALRRRFAWYTLYPRELTKVEKGKVFNKTIFKEINTLFENYATDEELNLQPGHSYFITGAKEASKGLNDEMKRRLTYEIMPLMKEYFAEGYLQEAKNEFAQLYYKYTNEYMYK